MIKRILRGISNILFIILLILLTISFYSWIQVAVIHEPYSSFMGYSIFEVVTGSMSGTIEINDYIIVKETKDIKLKDVVTFKDKDSIVTHRVVEIKPDSIVTMGDANTSEDVELKIDDIIGKVVYVIPNGGVWKKVFTDYKVIIAIFVTMGFFTLYFSLDEKKDKKDKKDKTIRRKKDSSMELPKLKKEEKDIELPKIK